MRYTITLVGVKTRRLEDLNTPQHSEYPLMKGAKDVLVHPTFPSIPRKDHIKTERKLHHLLSTVRQSGPSIQAGVSIRLTPLPYRSGPREDQNSI